MIIWFSDQKEGPGGGYLEYDLTAIHKRLNEVCGTQARLELAEAQEVRDMVELLIDCGMGGTRAAYRPGWLDTGERSQAWMSAKDFAIMKGQIVAMSAHSAETGKLYPAEYNRAWVETFPADPESIKSDDDLWYWVSQFYSIADDYVTIMKERGLHGRLESWTALLDEIGTDALDWQPS